MHSTLLHLSLVITKAGLSFVTVGLKASALSLLWLWKFVSSNEKDTKVVG